MKELLRTVPSAKVSQRQAREESWLADLDFWKVQAIGWGVLCIFPLGFWLTRFLPDPLHLWMVLYCPVSGFLMTSAVRPLCHDLSKRDWSPLRLLALFLPLSLVMGFAGLTLSERFGALIGFFPPVPGDRHVMTGFYMIYTLTLQVWFALYFALSKLREAVRLNQFNNSVVLELLYAQQNPHFLFNALTTIMEVGEKNRKVVALTQALCDYLRFSIRQGPGAKLFPLEEEIEALKNYLLIEKERFGEDLELDFAIQREAGSHPVPSFLAQPLIENAIKYGRRNSPKPLRIKVHAEVSGSTLQFSVTNTGSWVENPPEGSLGMGLTNLTQRLKIIYHGKSSLGIRHGDGMVSVKVTLPYEKMPTS